MLDLDFGTDRTKALAYRVEEILEGRGRADLITAIPEGVSVLPQITADNITEAEHEEEIEYLLETLSHYPELQASYDANVDNCILVIPAAD